MGLSIKMLSQTQWGGYYEIRTRLLSQWSKKVIKLIKLRKKERKSKWGFSINYVITSPKGGYQKQRKEETSNDKEVNWMKKEKQCLTMLSK